MKKLLMFLLAFFFATGSAFAFTTIIPDNVINWPGYESCYSGDSIGVPVVEDMAVTIEAGALASVVIDVRSRTVRNTGDWLFINIDGEWDTWDYVVVETTAGAAMYSVPESYVYTTYGGAGGRFGHPNGLEEVGAEVGFLQSLVYDDPTDLLTYTFDGLLLDTINEDMITIGYTMWCANDVTGGQIPIPEPATLLLLGTGFIGLAFLGRKKLFK